MPLLGERYRLEDFIEATGRITTRDHLFETFIAAMAANGFDKVNFSIGRDEEVPGDELGFGLISNYAESWQKYYVEKSFVEIDPVFKCAISTYHPFRWGDLERELDLSKRQVNFLRLGEEAGLHNGIGIPFSGPRSQIAGVALATTERTAEHMRNMDVLSAYCNQFYHSYKRIIRAKKKLPPKVVSLSAREKEIVRWLAAGKSDDQIGGILTISANTVDYHLRNIFVKLGANNRVSAVVIAITHGLIDL
jgi:DNA-binding CsgD family transcriptional regulator